jgi:hypothetical protein
MLRTSEQILENRVEVLLSRKHHLDVQLRRAKSAVAHANDRYDSLARLRRSAGRADILTAQDREVAWRRIRRTLWKSFFIAFAVPFALAAGLLLVEGAYPRCRPIPSHQTAGIPR